LGQKQQNQLKTSATPYATPCYCSPPLPPPPLYKAIKQLLSQAMAVGGAKRLESYRANSKCLIDLCGKQPPYSLLPTVDLF